MRQTAQPPLPPLSGTIHAQTDAFDPRRTNTPIQSDPWSSENDQGPCPWVSLLRPQAYLTAPSEQPGLGLAALPRDTAHSSHRSTTPRLYLGGNSAHTDGRCPSSSSRAAPGHSSSVSVLMSTPDALLPAGLRQGHCEPGWGPQGCPC